MAFKEVQDLGCDSAVALGGVSKKTGKKNPTKAQGYYLGSREVESAMSKTGKAKLHILQTPEGNVGVWGKTDLDAKMQAVPAGCLIRITQTGTVPTKKGNPMFKFKVEVDEENRIEVDLPENEGGSTQTTDGAGSDEDAQTFSEEDGEEDGDLDEEEEQADEQPLPRAAKPKKLAQAPSADSQAKVSALLRGRSQRNA